MLKLMDHYCFEKVIKESFDTQTSFLKVSSLIREAYKCPNNSGEFAIPWPIEEGSLLESAAVAWFKF